MGAAADKNHDEDHVCMKDIVDQNYWKVGVHLVSTETAPVI